VERKREMADNGKSSGDGKTSPFGPPSGQASKPSGGNNFVKNPGGSYVGGKPNDFIQNPGGNANKGDGHDFVTSPGGPMAEVPKQKSGSFRNESSVPKGGPTPFVQGGAEPAPGRKGNKEGFNAGGGPSGPMKKPFKVSKV
jgi:hypothetical protein